MDQLGDKLKNLSGDLKNYIETRLEILLLDISEQVTGWVSESIQKGIGVLLLSLGLLFALISLSIYLGELLDSQSLGFLIVSAPLLLLGLIFMLSSSKGLANGIQKSFMKSVLKSLEEKSEHSIKAEQKLLPPNKQSIEENKDGKQ